MNLALQLGGSIAAILFLAWLALRMGLGGDVRIRDEDHARELADHLVGGFHPVEVAIDKAGVGALLKDANGRHLVIRKHGAMFAGRLLDGQSDATLDHNLLTIGAGERMFGTVTLDLGDAAQRWAAGLRHA